MMIKDKKELLNKLNKLTQGKKSTWIKDAEDRANNSGLKYSQKIALQILRVLRSKKITQAQLANELNISAQQVSKWLKGKENFTIDTIAKIDEVLKINLLNVPVQIEQEADADTILIQVTAIQQQEISYRKLGETKEKTLKVGQMNEWDPKRKYSY
jgi:transcriptional regulator with XRE-family HTH domain